VRTCLKVLKLRRDSTIACKDPARSAEVEKTLWRVQSLRSSGGGTPLRIQVGAKVTGFTAETKVEAFWSKKSSKGKEEGHAQGRAQLPLDQLKR
jgi:hypothetical protein